MIASDTGKMRTALLVATLLTVAAASPSAAQERSGRPVIRYGNTSSFWFIDGRDDQRDFRNNGVFPGNFAGDPPSASIGIEGVFVGFSVCLVLFFLSFVVLLPPKPH